MIENFGIGIDIINIEKFRKKPFNKNKTFYENIFSKNEIKYCLKYKKLHEKFAAKFALKEAVIKSINEKIHFSEIETSYINQKPTVKLLNFSKHYKFRTSLSHENDFALAIVISEKIM